MKICWDNLEGIKLTKNGIFIKNNNVSLIYKNARVICGQDYLTTKHRPSIFCSKSCSHKGKKPWLDKKHSEKTKTKMSKSAINRSKNKVYIDKLRNAQLGSKSHSWKGGVSKSNIPLYNTYNKSLWPEKTSSSISGNLKVLNVRCTKCGNWYIPTTDAVQNRLKNLNGKVSSECRFYCSGECKNSCSIFGQIKYPKYFKINKEALFTENELKIWSKEVLKRANYICEVCGEKAVSSHHEQPKKLQPFHVLDPDNGVALCKKCHYKYGHKDNCSTGTLSHIGC
jgi:hypothetical protein